MDEVDAWRRVCLDAFDNLQRGTTVTMGQVDAVLMAGARQAAALDTSTTEGAAQYEHLIDGVAESTGVDRDDVDGILTWCAKGAAGLIETVPGKGTYVAERSSDQ